MLQELFSQPFTLWGVFVMFFGVIGFAYMTYDSIVYPPKIKTKKDD